ncbi:oligosaccharide flippase family protein [Crocosphaera sp. UHCC 0190]|uniref:oligosaccharide flippase family protein n=1 Tax=Crocosphaera sp. UHCC 0190 TaxID=3110246 RepID=UPI002B1FE0F2|nr:oligosaccharide flippase family protein [Crocosphaera sp. UHCC 0190]MEA5509907.1 oligosaccharide flippase family protein [Crocosphaera sp. UHCC 0190]
MSSTKKQAINGTIWTLVGYGGSQVIRLVSNIILTRLLAPELFGLMALMNTFIQGLAMFSDVGIQPSIVRSPRGDDPTFLNTAWTIQVIRGFGLWLACCLIAWPVAQFYGDIQLLWLLPIVGLTTIAAGFNSTALATLNRKMKIGKLTIFDVGIQVFSLTFMTIWAYFQRTIWPLVGGSLLGSFVKSIGSHYLEPEISNRFTWDKESVKELTSFGRWIFLSTMMTFIASRADRLILAKLFSLEVLGVYTIAITFAEIPKSIIQSIAGKVIFPVISQNIELPRHQLRAKIIRSRKWILIALAFGVAILVSFGDLLIFGLYDQRYAQAAWMLPLIALGLWPLILYLTIGPSLMALGKPMYTAASTSAKAIFMIMGLPIGFKLGGILGVIIVIMLNDLPNYCIINYGLYREKLIAISQDVKLTMFLVSLILGFSSVRFFGGFGISISSIL